VVILLDATDFNTLYSLELQNIKNEKVTERGRERERKRKEEILTSTLFWSLFHS
jgi:hypothetical protein